MRLIDNKINLTEICRSCDWHLTTAIEELIRNGFSRDDAGSFANFEFNENAIESNGKYDTVSSDDYLSDDQLERVSDK